MAPTRPDLSAVRRELPASPAPEFGRALAAACALVASADGWPAEEERRQLLQRLRLLAASGVLDVDDVVVAFDHFMEALIIDLGAAEPSCIALIARFRPDPALARALAHACNAVAMADGGYDEAERQAALRICRAIGLPPTEIGIAVAP